MQRDKIILGENIYIVDRYLPSDSIIKTSNEFVILRKFEFVDNLTFDSDVYVIDKDLWEMSQRGEWTLAYPNTYSSGNYNQTAQFSNKIENFNDSFKYNFHDLGYIYRDKITDEEGNVTKTLAKINCDLIRIYHPHNKTNQKMVIYIDSYINSIHFHFYCAPIFNLKSYSETEFIENNFYYSEYVEFAIPNVEEIFRDTYYDDSLNLIQGYKDTSFVPMKLFKTLYKIGSEKGDFTKEYLGPEYKTGDSSLFTNTIKVTLFPYSHIDDVSKNYVLEEDLLPNSCIFINKVDFKLKAAFELNNIPILKCNFELPENSLYDNFKQAYEYYNDVSIDEYRGLIYEPDENDDEYEAEIYGDKPGEEMNMCGYQLEISTDIHFKNIVYEKSNWDIDFDDFAFQLNGIFEKWTQYPETLVCRARFIDRYLGNIIESNQVMITKEIFKYMINDSLYNRVDINLKPLEFTIDIDEGVDKIIINDIIYNKSQTIACPYGTYIRWKIILKDGYKTEDKLEGQFDVLDNSNNISVKTEIIKYTLKLQYNEYILKYIINGIDYPNIENSECEIEFTHGDQINWDVEVINGYFCEEEIKTFIINSDTTIFATISPVSYKVEFMCDLGIQYIYINGEQYLINDNDPLILYIPYKTHINWHAEILPGYRFNSESSGEFIVSDNEKDNIMNILCSANKFNVDIKINKGISYIEVNSLRYKESKTILVDYSSKIFWKIVLLDNYHLIEGDLEGEEIIYDDIEINPIAIGENRLLTFELKNCQADIKINNETTNISSNIIKDSKDEITFKELEVLYGDDVEWTVIPNEGYKLNLLNATDKFTVSDNVTISLLAEIIKIPVKIRFNYGISKIIINDKEYFNNDLLYFDYGQTINWTSECAEGYECEDNEGSFVVISSEENYTINPIPSIIKCNFQIIGVPGIQKVIINNEEYKNIDIDQNLNIEYNYGTFISWKIVLSENYKLKTGELEGFLKITEDTNILIETEFITIPFVVYTDPDIYTIELVSGNDTMIIEDEVFEASCYYDSIILWKVILKNPDKYECKVSTGIVEAKNYDSFEIRPTINIKKYKVNIVINEGISSITINEDTYRTSRVIEFDYDTEIHWEAQLIEGYKIDEELSGNFIVSNEDMTISPKPEKIAINLFVSITEGIEYVSINNIKITSNTYYEGYFKYGDRVNIEIKTLQGYELINYSEQYSESLTIEGTYTIVPITKLIKVPVNINIGPGIETIEIISPEEFKSTLNVNYIFDIDYGTEIIYKVNCTKGFYMNDLTNTVIVNNINGITINPIVEKIDVILNLNLDKGIDYIIINNVKYNRSERLKFKYFDNIEWEAFEYPGYKLISKRTGKMTLYQVGEGELNNPYIIDFNVLTEEANIPVEVVINKGVDQITINDEIFNVSGIYNGKYNEKLSWIAIVSDNYILDNYFGNIVLNDINKNYIISPAPSIKQTMIDLIFNPGIISYEINGTSYNRSQIVYIDYGEVINWSVTIDSNYEIDPESIYQESGTLEVNTPKISLEVKTKTK